VKRVKGFLVGLALGVFLVGGILTGAIIDRGWGISVLDKLILPKSGDSGLLVDRRVLKEENVVIDVVEKVNPGVVTVSVSKTRLVGDLFSFDPFGLFGRLPDGKEEKVEQDIGNGFILSADGLIVTNKNVV